MTATLHHAPNYPIRRAAALVLVLLALVIAATAAISMVEAVAGLGGRPAAASEVAAEDTASSVRRIHVAEPGDTMWSIAEAHRGDVGRDRFIDALIDLNGGTAIQAGQAIRLP